MNKSLCIFILLLAVPALLVGLQDSEKRTVTTHGKPQLLVDHKPYIIPESRDLLFDQTSASQGAFAACQADSSFSFYPRIADNFVLASDSDIDSIVFWGGYWNPGYPGSPLGYNIEFYPDSGGGNGPCQNPVYFQEVMFTETQISGDWCVYEGAIPTFSASGGVTYWLVTQMVLTYPPQFGTNCSSPPSWGDGQEGYFKSAYFGYPQWVNATSVFGTPYENGFQLHGTPAGGEPDIDCTPNPLVYNAKDYDGELEFTYRMYPQRISEELQEKMANSTAHELLPVIVEFNKIINTQFLYNLVEDLPKDSRRNITINTLQDFTTEYQHDVWNYLESMETEGKVERLSQLWLTNSIGMNVTKDVIGQISNHPRIAYIWLDDKLTQPHGRKTEAGYDEAVQDGREIVWNVSRVNADDVWGIGYTGDGVVVGHIDTGCNYNHNDLSSHMWDGGSSYPNHGYDYIDNDNNPMDTHGHGTHTAGTVSSDGTAGSNCGVAPDALMMILRGVPGSMSVLQNCVNFCLSQGADVITMSAGWDSAGAGGSWNSLSTQNRNMLDNCMTAGVVFATSAGNGDGYGGHYNVPYDIGIPANTPAPWYGSAGHSAAMAVGATTSGNSWASFSSYGPTQWWFSPWYEYQHPPGLIKPDIAAPGGSPGIKSCAYYNNSSYVSGWTGTSMACPHVAGCIALMLEKDPSLMPEELDSIIETTAVDLGSAGRDNYYGAGLLDCLAAVNAVGGTSPVAGTFYCHNLGTASLNVSGIAWSEPWVSDVNPTSFSVSPGDSEGVNVDVDTSGLSPGTYYDTLWISSNDPDEDPYGEVIILYHGTGIEEETPIVKTYPAGYAVRCFPNPAKHAASLMFTLPRKGDITLEVFDATGRKVSTVAEGRYEGGTHQIVWNRKDAHGTTVPQGIYFVRLKAKGIEAKGKLILVN
jgi:serine protease AprX